MTWKSSSEQSFKLTGIALMIVKVLRGMGEIRTVLSASYPLRANRQETRAEKMINLIRITTQRTHQLGTPTTGASCELPH